MAKSLRNVSDSVLSAAKKAKERAESALNSGAFRQVYDYGKDVIDVPYKEVSSEPILDKKAEPIYRTPQETLSARTEAPESHRLSTTQLAAYRPDDYVDPHDDPSSRFDLYEEEDGKLHYTGASGDFSYDPSEWQLDAVRVEADGAFPGGSFQVLRYIGKETDGSKIHIPEGITNCTEMFKGTDIKSAPAIPNSAVSCTSMFADCKNLKEGTWIPKNVKETCFMFEGCENLRYFDDPIPGNVDSACYMFKDCKSLETAPEIKEGVKDGEGMFANCESLRKNPKIPSSMRYREGMTTGCKGLDQTNHDVSMDAYLSELKKQHTEIDSYRKSTEKKRDVKERSLQKKAQKGGLMTRAGNVMSAIMQMYAMQDMGYGMFMAPMMVYLGRRNGTLQTGFKGGLSAIASAGGNTQAASVLNKMAHQDEKKRIAKANGKVVSTMEKWDGKRNARLDKMNENVVTWKLTHSIVDGHKSEMTNVYGRMAMRQIHNGILQEDMSDRSYMGNLRDQMLFGQDYGMKMKSVDLNAQANGGMPERAIADEYKKWLKDSISGSTVYCQYGQRYAQEHYKGSDLNQASQNLDAIGKIQLDPIVDSLKEMQSKYRMFNAGDMREIIGMLNAHPSGKEIAKELSEGESKRFQSHMNETRIRQANDTLRRFYGNNPEQGGMEI